MAKRQAVRNLSGGFHEFIQNKPDIDYATAFIFGRALSRSVGPGINLDRMGDK